MATIPETPPEEQTLPGSRDRARAIPTVEESSGPTPQNNFTTPFISGESTLRGISELTDNLNRVSDAYVEREAKIKGAQDQQQAIAEGRSDYVGTGTAFTLAGRNYEAGATIALINKKRSEIDEQLKPLALKRKNDINLFSKEADEIRNRLVQNLPSSVAVQVNEEYLKEKGNLTTQIQLNQVKEQIEENRITILDGNDRETKKMMDAIRDQGMGATQIMDSLININSNVEGLSSLGLTPNEIRKEMDKQRKKIFSLYLYQYEFQKYANDPAGLEKLKTELRNGTYQWGDLGNEFGNYIPGGKDITVAEGQVYHKVVEQYEADYAKENAGQRYLFNIDHKQKADSIADGQSGFTVTWSTDPNGEPVKIVGLDPNYNAYDTAKSRLLGNDAADILKQKLELESSVLAGQLVLQTKIGNEATMNNAYTSIAQFEAKANDPKSTAYEKGLYGQAADKARTRVDKIIKNRLADKTSGESMNMFWETRAAYGIDPNINITTAEGFRVLQKEYEKYNNSPMRDTEFPTQQANIELSQIRQSANISMASGMASLDQLNARMKEYSTAVLSSALKAAGDEKNNDYALIEIMNLRKQGRLAESERLFSAWKDSEQNEKILKQSDPNYKTYKDSFESKFRDEFKNTIDLKTSYGKSLYSTSHALWLKNLQAGVMNNRDSMDSAITFVKQHHVSLQLDDGLTILFPRSYLRDDNGTDRRNYIENELNDVLNKPWLHNVIPASGQTFDRITNNKDQYKFVFDNGQFVLRDKAGDIVAQPLQKYPSDERTLIYSDMVISPGNSKKSKTVFEDRENTWANGGKKTFTNLVGDGPNVSTYLFTDKGENKIEKYADKMQRVFVENYVNQDKKLKYVDWAVPHMVGIDARKQTVAQAISLKAAENGLNQADLVWLANNSVTASRVGLDRKDNRDYVINKFNSDYDKISKLTTPTNAATRMSPMQVILKLSDEYNTIGKK